MNYINSLLPTTIGFDRLFRLMDAVGDIPLPKPSYPHYNIVKTTEDCYSLELAVAGFSESEISIELEKDDLVITGEKVDEKRDYVYNGLANRKFRKLFSLAENIIVDSAELKDGLLKITLKVVKPVRDDVKKIPINFNTIDPPKMLTE